MYCKETRSCERLAKDVEARRKQQDCYEGAAQPDRTFRRIDCSASTLGHGSSAACERMAGMRRSINCCHIRESCTMFVNLETAAKALMLVSIISSIAFLRCPMSRNGQPSYAHLPNDRSLDRQRVLRAFCIACSCEAIQEEDNKVLVASCFSSGERKRPLKSEVLQPSWP
jgi:hypothetical protein